MLRLVYYEYTTKIGFIRKENPENSTFSGFYKLLVAGLEVAKIIKKPRKGEGFQIQLLDFYTALHFSTPK